MNVKGIKAQELYSYAKESGINLKIKNRKCLHSSQTLDMGARLTQSPFGWSKTNYLVENYTRVKVSKHSGNPLVNLFNKLFKAQKNDLAGFDKKEITQNIDDFASGKLKTNRASRYSKDTQIV